MIMKQLSTLFMLAATAVLMVSCGTSKKLRPAVESNISSRTTVEGTQANVETMKLQGIEMSEALSEDGTSMIQRPYKWYAGIAQADNKQVAIEMAQREAYATISRVLNNAVNDNAKRGNVANNGRVQQALTSHWEQISTSLQKGCEPFGNTSIEYDQATRMYTAIAKVGIRGDRFNQLLDTAGSFKPDNLSGEDLEQFIETNKAIMNAAKGE